MTNQDPNEIEEAPAAVPQTRTFNQWIALCGYIQVESPNHPVESSYLLSHEVRWEDSKLMILDYAAYAVYDPTTNEQNCSIEFITGLLVVIDNFFIGHNLVSAFANIGVTI